MPKKNGFLYFMREFKYNEEKHGKQFPNGLRDVQSDPKCSQAWNALSAEEKNSYHRRGSDKSNVRGKFTGTGESVELLEKAKREQMEYEANMKETIDQSINEANRIGNLGMLSFYFIHVNHFYTKASLDEKWTDYIPAEYAVVEFSLEHGIKRIHHQIINTEIELGYTREYIEHSDETHKLSNDIAEGEKNYATMYNNLIAFLKLDKTLNKCPPLYTSKKMKTIVPCLLERMTAAAKVDTMTFDLYSLEYVFGSLLGSVNDKFSETADHERLANAHLEKDAFLWTPNIECFYHIGIEGTGPYCSQSIVQQWCFTIADYCCKELSIQMVQGSHCPMDNFIAEFEALKVQKVGTLKSDTGVSESYRHMVGSRTREDEERRRNQGGTLLIIDHGKETIPKPTINYSAASSASTGSRTATVKQMREPKTMAKAFASADVPLLNDDNFPAIGGRGRARLGKSDVAKPTVGRGRGGVMMD